ncbi:MAG: hypothetical protein AAF773_00260 [Cyanobacteria bacterium P01_D01_bin.115]
MQYDGKVLRIPSPDSGIPPKYWPPAFRAVNGQSCWDALAAHLEKLQREADRLNARLRKLQRLKLIDASLSQQELSEQKNLVNHLYWLERAIPPLKRAHKSRPNPGNAQLNTKVLRLGRVIETASQRQSSEMAALTGRLARVESVITDPRFIQGMTLIKQMASSQRRTLIGYGEPPPRVRIDSPDPPTEPFSAPIPVTAKPVSGIDSVIERYGPRSNGNGRGQGFGEYAR